MRTVLVGVRTPLAARHIASAAARLGLSSAVRTAVSTPEVMSRLAERPVDLVLADTALTRPDSAAFVRRVLAHAPEAAILLLGVEESAAAAAAVTAGARGLIQGDHGLAASVAKALLLIAAARPADRRMAAVAGAERALPAEGSRSADPQPPAGTGWSPMTSAIAAAGSGTAAAGSRSGDGPGGPAVVPAQRDDGEPDATAADDPAHRADGRRDAAGPDDERGAFAARNPAKRDSARTVALTERELQVLLGMAEGKSNAEIGRELFVSEDTVKTHARRLFRKLGARDRAHAVAAGFRAGLVA